ncbi:NADH-quinone oxidoreductase subunit L [Buchnera aphidicola]|uniref:NADH-quinone oxidoreductase subunit L n=1 Tax=Buchnera aphidicola (Anoecia oenotherae) TaxID=1241833 RepID=A0A4D6XV49_9GAMM|nr:NADH-quinone oxidoreductase subunit L [Buchnera aphidicola]QCI19267.1 NADH-quinone oxidoreductase subunit L [Buchnera aphidicola (Anoecia oenotherae)]
MNHIIYLTILSPVISFLLLTVFKKTFSYKINHAFGISGLILSLLSTIYTYKIFIQKNLLENFNYPVLTIFDFNLNSYNLFNGLFLDQFSLSMLMLITIIGTLVYTYSISYMEFKKNKFSFFAYINFFISGMILLILSNNLLLMYIGWEVVGLFSFLLIGFYNSKIENGINSIKTFLITRTSDIFLLFSILITHYIFGTLNFELIKIKSIHFHNWSIISSFNLYILSFCLLIGSIGKSAQVPLHIWLSKAMVGPTPVSALIHAATMVTAGVYLIIRTHILLCLCPKTLEIISIIGVVTLILSSFCALFEKDIKKILAYSTISQLGYMFLSLGIQAWNAAFLHLINHAFFKALLFLSAGSLINLNNGEKNIFKLGSIKKKPLLLYVFFLIGSSSLVSFPIITSGFYSKELILYALLNQQHTLFLLLGFSSIFLTSLYTFRMFFILFHSNQSINLYKKRMTLIHDLPLLILAICSTVIGYLIICNVTQFYYTTNIFDNKKSILEIVSSIFCIFGILCAYFLWGSNNIFSKKLLSSTLVSNFKKLFYTQIGLEKIYTYILVKPFFFITSKLRYDPISIICTFPVKILKKTNNLFLQISSGYIRWYIFLIMTSTTYLLYIHNFLCTTYL